MSGNSRRNKYKRKYYNNSSNKNILRHELVPGLRGFLVTCANSTEKFVVRECYNLLNEYADKLYGPEDATDKGKGERDDDKQLKRTDDAAGHDERDDSEEEDINKGLEKELSSLREASSGKQMAERRFQQVSTNVKQVLFIRTLVDNPVALVKYMFEDISTKKTKKNRYIQRFLPVSITCKANPDTIIKCAKSLIRSTFTPDSDNNRDSELAAVAADSNVEPVTKRVRVESGEDGEVADSCGGRDKTGKVEEESGSDACERVEGETGTENDKGEGSKSEQSASSSSNVERERERETFGVVYKVRNNSISRLEIIPMLAEFVSAIRPDMKVCLKNPTHTITVDILANMCCLCIVQDYDKFKKYNLNELDYSEEVDNNDKE